MFLVIKQVNKLKMEKILLCVIAVVFIICAFLAWYFIFTAKQNERMRMIEKGLTPDLPVQNKAAGSTLLKIGIIIIGLGIGIFLTDLIQTLEIMHFNQLPIAVLSISGGIAMLIANYVGKKNG